MSWVAASGRDTYETCEADTSTIVAFARSATNRWSAGGIALSSVPSRYQHGSVFHAGGRAGERRDGVRPLRSGHDVRRGLVDVDGEGLRERLGVEEEQRTDTPRRPRRPVPSYPLTSFSGGRQIYHRRAF